MGGSIAYQLPAFSGIKLNLSLGQGHFTHSFDKLSTDAVFLISTRENIVADTRIVATYGKLTSPSVLAKSKPKMGYLTLEVCIKAGPRRLGFIGSVIFGSFILT